MTSSIFQRSRLWIHSAGLDLFFFSFGWLLLFAVFIAMDQSSLKSSARSFLIVSILLFSFLHRHLTFPMVYGDREIFQQRKIAYVVFPLLFLVLTLLSLKLTSLMILLVGLSVLWNIYHTLMQKIGLLRIYSRKAGYGKSWLDKSLVFSWFFFLFFYLASKPENLKLVSTLSGGAKVFQRLLMPISLFLPSLSKLVFLVACILLFLYLKEEWQHRSQMHWPKNLFLLSIFMLYAAFAYDILVGYALFGFSHAIEYLAFVNVFARRKYRMRDPSSSWIAGVIRRQGLAMMIYCLSLISVFVLWRWYSLRALGIYILGSSFLHFLYDGWIWKVRNAQVGEPLAIRYQEA